MDNVSTSFPSHGVLSATTGILMGDIGALYGVFSFVVGRSVFTHELPRYSDAVKDAIITAHPELPAEATGENWERVRDGFIASNGETYALNASLKGALADGENAFSNLPEKFGGRP